MVKSSSSKSGGRSKRKAGSRKKAKGKNSSPSMISHHSASKPGSKKGHRKGQKGQSEEEQQQSSRRSFRSSGSSQSSSRSYRGGENRQGPKRSFHKEFIAIDDLASTPVHRQTQDTIKSWLNASMSKRTVQENPPDSKLMLDPWQQEAVQALDEGFSVVVDAPTTAGKTRVVEAMFHKHISDPTFRAAYTTPVKSLSNDKVREFRETFGSQNVGISTGDIKENLDAPIVVATLESYRNSLLGVEPDLGRNLVVFDEYHYVQDESRGSAWEEAIVLTPDQCQILMLSASVANADQFSAWLNQTQKSRKAVLVATHERPVPLEHLVWFNGGYVLADLLPPNWKRKLDRRLLQTPIRYEGLSQRLAQLIPLGLTPCIVYTGRRLGSELLCDQLARVTPLLQEEDATRISELLERAQTEFKGLSFLPSKLRQMIQRQGIAYHHSGLAAPARMTIELLVKQGALRFCTATMGLSLGINFAVRTAVISDYERPGESGFTIYAASEVLQMLGRAGRRGKDVVGISAWPTLEAYAHFGDVKRDDASSRLRIDPTTFLGLVGRGFSIRAIESFYAKSFWQFSQPNLSLKLMTKSKLQKHLNADDLPCGSPAHAYGRFLAQDEQSACNRCPYRQNCHQYIRREFSASKTRLAALHFHLHACGALTDTESLTSLGSVARYFPQAGGLMVAEYLESGKITADNMDHACQLFAALTLAHFKEPGCPGSYHFPFTPKQIIKDLEKFYPLHLFPEIYDQHSEGRPVIREFNTRGGYPIYSWLQGGSWPALAQSVTTPAYGSGDLMSLIYRVATYLQSITQAYPGFMAEVARAHRSALLREPLNLALSI